MTDENVSEMVKAALVQKGMSINDLIRQTHLSRAFVFDLLNCKPRKNKSSGYRKATHDPRYEKIRDALGLPEDFIAAVVRLQNEQSKVSSPSVKEAPHDVSVTGSPAKGFRAEIPPGCSCSIAFSGGGYTIEYH